MLDEARQLNSLQAEQSSKEQTGFLGDARKPIEGRLQIEKNFQERLRLFRLGGALRSLEDVAGSLLEGPDGISALFFG
jgi:hypothetical protein